MVVMKPWIAKKVFDTLGFEDEVVLEFIYTMLEEDTIDPRKMQIDLTGFFERKAADFMSELYSILLSAQKNPDGIPEQFIQAKKQELLLKLEHEKAIAEQLKEQQSRINEQRLKANLKNKLN
ncbi:PWI domain-containing protein, partial [Smittium culicis]